MQSLEVCLHCEQEYYAKNSSQKFCCKAHAQAYNRAIQQKLKKRRETDREVPVIRIKSPSD